MASPTEKFLLSFHARHAHANGALFDTGLLASQQTTYDLLVESVGSQARSVLDLGCGDGALLVQLKSKLGIRAVGLDFSPDQIAAARKLVPDGVRLLCARAQQLPLEDAVVDAVVSHMALMLMEDFDRVLEEVRRVVKPGGTFCAVVSGPSHPTDESHVFFSTLRRLMQSEGLTPSFGADCFRSVEGIKGAWKQAGFDVPVVEDHVLTRRVPAGGLRAFFEQAYYPVALLSDPARAALGELVEQGLQPFVHDGHLTWRSGIRSIRVTR